MPSTLFEVPAESIPAMLAFCEMEREQIARFAEPANDRLAAYAADWAARMRAGKPLDLTPLPGLLDDQQPASLFRWELADLAMARACEEARWTDARAYADVLAAFDSASE